MSTLIHEAARIRLGVQKCRRCGYLLHDHSDWPNMERNAVRWKAGALVVNRLTPPPVYRYSWASQNCPKKVLAEAVFCDAPNTERSQRG